MSEVLSSEVIEYLSEFLLRFSKSNSLPDEWPEKFKAALLRLINETSEPVRTDLILCFDQLETSSKKPGWERKLFSSFWKEFIKRMDKDPGGKSRYNWADTAFKMKHELKLGYEYIYPAVCEAATGKRFEDLEPDKRRQFEEQCRSLVFLRKREAFRIKIKKP